MGKTRRDSGEREEKPPEGTGQSKRLPGEKGPALRVTRAAPQSTSYSRQNESVRMEVLRGPAQQDMN